MGYYFPFIPLFAIATPFVFVIAIVWLKLHYKERNRQYREAEQTGADRDEDLLRIAERLEQRIATLEKILDAEAPDWRKTHEH